MSAVRIQRKSLALLALLVPLLKPEGLAILAPSVEKCFMYVFYIDAAIIVCWFMYSVTRRSKKISLVFLITVLYVALELSITILSDGSVYAVASNWLRVILIGMLVECCSDDIESMLRVMLVYLEILLYVNLVCVLLFPSGMFASEIYFGFDTNWLLGYKSSLQYYVIPAIAIALVFAIRKKRYMHFVFLLVICHIESAAVRNIMLLAGLVLFDVIVYLMLRRRIRIPYKAQVIAVAVLNVLFIGFGELAVNGQGVLNWLFTNVLGKVETLVSRLEIWDSVLGQIPGYLLYGHGTLSDAQRFQAIGDHAHAHNQLLQTIFESGIVGLFVFLLIFALLIRVLANQDDDVSLTFGYVIFVVFAMCAFEIFTRGPGSYLWGVFFIAYYSSLLACDNRRFKKDGKRWR